MSRRLMLPAVLATLLLAALGASPARAASAPVYTLKTQWADTVAAAGRGRPCSRSTCTMRGTDPAKKR